MLPIRRTIKLLATLPLVFCALLTASVGVLAAQTPAAPASAPTPAAVQAKSTLTVRITGFRNAKGRIKIALFRDAKGFPSNPSSAIASQSFEIDPQSLSATAVFKNIPQGVYAASVLHDENMTGKMEFDAQGVPQSGYGFSNNPDTSHGPPMPDQSSFIVSQSETTIEIKMVYWQ
ncbi:MAG: DUF2141 domain-containing protein [Terracidiphilus sp.]